jgi:hypothetical protein
VGERAEEVGAPLGKQDLEAVVLDHRQAAQLVTQRLVLDLFVAVDLLVAGDRLHD